jgi:hypothetical protein
MDPGQSLDSIVSTCKFLGQYNLNDLVARVGKLAQDIKSSNITEDATQQAISDQLTGIVGDLKLQVPPAELPRFKAIIAIALEAIGAFGLKEESQAQAFKGITSKVLSLL